MISACHDTGCSHSNQQHQHHTHYEKQTTALQAQAKREPAKRKGKAKRSAATRVGRPAAGSKRQRKRSASPTCADSNNNHNSQSSRRAPSQASGGCKQSKTTAAATKQCGGNWMVTQHSDDADNDYTDEQTAPSTSQRQKHKSQGPWQSGNVAETDVSRRARSTSPTKRGMRAGLQQPKGVKKSTKRGARRGVQRWPSHGRCASMVNLSNNASNVMLHSSILALRNPLPENSWSSSWCTLL